MPEQVVQTLEVVNNEYNEEIDESPADVSPGMVALLPEDAARIAAADFLTTETICRSINAKIGSSVNYSEPMRSLLFRAWSFAALLRNNNVSVDHLIAALATSEATLGKTYSDQLGDRIVPLAATMSRLATQRAVAGSRRVDALRAQKPLQDWLAEAVHLCEQRDATVVDLELDFLGVLTSSTARKETRKSLSEQFERSREAGRAETQLDRVRRDAASASQNTSRLRSNVRDDLKDAISKVETAVATATADIKSASNTLGDTHRAALGEAIGKLHFAVDQKTDALKARVGALAETVDTSLKAHSSEFKAASNATSNRQNVMITDLKQSLKSAEDVLAYRHAAIAREVEDLAAELKAAQTQPPRVIALIGLIVAAIGLGAGIGYAIFTLAPKLLAL